MEGACVYIDEYNFSTLFMYKELPKKNTVFYLKYCNYSIYHGFITIKDLDKLLCYEHVYILNHLPYIHDIDLTINVWKNLAFDKLNQLNQQ